MAKTIVDSTGQMRTIVDSRQVQLEKKYDLMEEALRKGEIHFTKTSLGRDYGLSRPEVWSFVRLMDTRQILAKDNPVTKLIGNRTVFSEPSWHIVDRPTSKAVPAWAQSDFPGKTTSRRQQRRLAGRHLCDRCGSTILGKGRHNKSSRGHTRELCDLAMVSVIHDA